MNDAEAKRKASLATLRTRKAERDARTAQKKAIMDMTHETNAPAPEAQEDEVEQSHHQFPDPREGELWDSISIHQAVWKKAEAENPDVVDIGEVYIPPTVSAMIANLYNKLRDLHSRDKAESAKILNFKKKAEEESDEDFKAGAEASWQKIDAVNLGTKGNVNVYHGRIRSAIDACCKTHNDSVMEADARK